MQSLSIYSTLDIAICAYATLYGCQEECQDRFFEFILLQSATAESVGTAVKEHLAKIRRVSSSARCMAEAVMRDDAAGVQRKIQDKYPMPTTSTAVHIGSF